MATCRSCGEPIPDAGRFCSSCGASQTGDGFATRTVAASKPRSSSGSNLNIGRFLPGAMLGDRYRIVALLGKGGMGEVYRADDLSLGQQVALKFLPQAVTHDESAMARFRNEVRIARQVSHPNVCRVYDLGEAEGHLFLSMEYVDGEDLGSLLRRIGRLPADKALEIARKLCAGLAAAHEKGVLHRDLKPANVMLDGRGQALITDFGLAALAGNIEEADVRSGTPDYMAPEQLAGREVTVRSDIYALGLVLYEIFTGKRPFEANTLNDLVRARSKTAPASPSSLVRELDPAVERVILRCLESDPLQRPASALAVAAALPGGDPLAAALAAGETPSPQMVAAAGETTGLAPRSAILCLTTAIAGLIAICILAYNYTAPGMRQLEYSPEILTQKARDIIRQLGYSAAPADTARGFGFEWEFSRYVDTHDKPHPQWDKVMASRPGLLDFWYRQSPRPMTAIDYHDDLLTPGIVTSDDPPPITSGMIDLALDPHGRLISFQAIPDELQTPAGSIASADWAPLFSAAGLDVSQLHPAEPLWTSLATSDVRAAWTGSWPGTARPLRVEAAALRGQPVFFSLIGPWTRPDRMQSYQMTAGEKASEIVLITTGILTLIGAVLLAHLNYLRGRGDRQGASRLAAFIFCAQMAIWLCRNHFVPTAGMFGLFVMAVSTSLFAAATMWIVYLALEPYVRRHWPHTLISWSRVLAGRIRDPLVGRDALFGILLGIGWALAYQVRYLLMQAAGAAPNFPSTDFLEGTRAMLAAWLIHIPYSVRSTLVFFLVLFLLRALLRNQWLAGAVFVLVFAAPKILGSDHLVIETAAQLLIFTAAMVAVLRSGLMTLAIGVLVADTLLNMPVTFDPSAWYFGSFAFVLLAIVALAAFSFHNSIAGKQLWKADLFG